MGFFTYLLQDRQANRENPKGQLVMFMFRLASYIDRFKLLKVVFILYLIFYLYWIDGVLGIGLPRKVTVGKGLSLFHGQGLVVNAGVVIGENCVLRSSTTIGNKKLADGSFSKCPRIGNNVDIGANVCIIGDIEIGNNVVIGAGSVVVRNVPSNCVVVGNPARLLEKKDKTSHAV